MRLRFLSIIPFLLLSGCTANEKSDSSHTISKDNKVYENVWYDFVYEKHCYCVTIDTEIYEIPPKNYYLVEISEMIKTRDGKSWLNNEYYIGSNELFVYIKK